MAMQADDRRQPPAAVALAAVGLLRRPARPAGAQARRPRRLFAHRPRPRSRSSVARARAHRPGGRVLQADRGGRLRGAGARHRGAAELPRAQTPARRSAATDDRSASAGWSSRTPTSTTWSRPTHVVSQTLEERGLLGAAPVRGVRLRRPRPTAPVDLVYLYKRGTFYPFAPREGKQARQRPSSCASRGCSASELPLEPELERWYPVWGARCEPARAAPPSRDARGQGVEGVAMIEPVGLVPQLRLDDQDDRSSRPPVRVVRWPSPTPGQHDARALGPADASGRRARSAQQPPPRRRGRRAGVELPGVPGGVTKAHVRPKARS